MMLNNNILVTDYYLKIVEFYTEKLGVIGGFFLSFIENLFPPLPIFAIVIANVTAFGTVVGFLISFLGHLLGAYTVFIFFRIVVKPRLIKKLKEDSKILKFERWFSKRSFPSILLVLSLPFFPYFFINIAAAFSEMNKRTYLIALTVGNFFMTLYLSVVGITVNNAIKNQNYYALIYPLLLMIVAYLTGKLFEKKLNLK